MIFIFDMLKGMVMGIANVIPGVSGGTMAVSMGIYDKLIGSITHLFKDLKKSIITLLPIGLGMVIGILALARVIEFMFESYSRRASHDHKRGEGEKDKAVRNSRIPCVFCTGDRHGGT